MVDTWATVGSCAQIGKNVHISGGVGIGGVLEPLQAEPVIIEDNCFIGARSEVAEGVIVRKGAVLSMGVFLGASTKIVDRDTGEIFIGEVPAYSVVVPGALPGKPMKNGQTGPSHRLRRDRQARRRADALQDQHQRAAAGLRDYSSHRRPGGLASTRQRLGARGLSARRVCARPVPPDQDRKRDPTSAPQAGRGERSPRRLIEPTLPPSRPTSGRPLPPGAFGMDWTWYLFRFDGRINRACCGRRC